MARDNYKLGMNSVGGYFSLELIKGKEFHIKTIHSIIARNALDYVLMFNIEEKISMMLKFYK